MLSDVNSRGISTSLHSVVARGGARKKGEMSNVEKFPALMQMLLEYRVKHGHLNVPGTFHNRDLARFVRNFRRANKSNIVPIAYHERLTALSFQFSPKEENWATQYEKLAVFFEKHGHAKVPRDYEDAQLAIWVMHQRDYMRTGNLSAPRIEKLKCIRFIFEPHDEQWAANIERLKAFYAKHGCIVVPRRCADKQLGTFASEMRERYKAGTLSQSQIQELSELGFLFAPKDLAWDVRASEYEEWVKNNPGKPVPRRINERASPLYKWVRTVKQNLEAGKLCDRKISKLKEIGFSM